MAQVGRSQHAQHVQRSAEECFISAVQDCQLCLNVAMWQRWQLLTILFSYFCHLTGYGPKLSRVLEFVQVSRNKPALCI